MTTLIVTLPTTPPRSFVAWRDGAPVLDPAWERVAAAAIDQRIPVYLSPASSPRPAGWGTIEQAIGTLRYLYGGRCRVSSPDADISLATLEPIPEGAVA